MLREIIWKELLDHLQSLRFALTLVLDYCLNVDRKCAVHPRLPPTGRGLP